VQREESFNEEGILERREVNAGEEKTQEYFEIGETDSHKPSSEKFKEQAGPTAEQHLPEQKPRVPGRRRGGWRAELKYL
jgi:hypothetical protein